MEKEIPLIGLGLVLMLSGILVTVFEPPWIVSVDSAMGGLIGAGVAALTIGVFQLKKKKNEEIINDERDYRIAEKATFRVFQVMFPLLGFSFAVISFVENQLMARPALALLFGLMGVLYAAFFRYYRRKM